ncbi:hypothetical protein OOZ54_13250 [Rhodopseudomonas palustris]|uniref:hypothetical protein n=1 Tax=Rhodopseudomonas palustris TaxID=1076 RepID=UPI0022F011F8|nr:hypothetical protein [Rhodopseudomonas palustris]WBU27630.1 hypothetical protein OOZ54_13250 [Rhodopseudomonas palustris]
MVKAISFHRWVRIEDVPDYLLLGWIALPTLQGTPHGEWSVHCAWLCSCPMVEPVANREHERGQ